MPAPMTVLALAVALDLLLGEPPNRWHPVAWLGALIVRGRPRAARTPWRLLLRGAVLILLVATIAAAGALAADAALALLPASVALLGRAGLLKCAFSIDALVAAVLVVRGHLVAADLPGARQQVAWHLVSRDTSDLDAPAVASASVESLAENLTDGLVAPVLFYVAGVLLHGTGLGLALAWAYRAVNTADAMIGYRHAELLYLGRATARADDVLNYVPARLAAATIVLGAWCAGESPAAAARAWRRDGGRTGSPNAGQTMAAMAGALGVTLEKRGYYRLGEGPAPDVAAIDRALRVAGWAAALGLATAGLALCAS